MSLTKNFNLIETWACNVKESSVVTASIVKKIFEIFESFWAGLSRERSLLRESDGSNSAVDMVYNVRNNNAMFRVHHSTRSSSFKSRTELLNLLGLSLSLR